MIINIRGTSGSGKSYLARQAMEQYPCRAKLFEEGRKQPIGYLCYEERTSRRKSLLVLGHYETDCGGCDTINGMDKIFSLVRDGVAQGHHVLFEGLLISAEVNRTAALMDLGVPMLVIGLNLPLQECLDSVNSRRAAKAERLGREAPGPVNPKNTESKWKGTQGSIRRLQSHAVTCEWHDRESAAAKLVELLR